MTPQQELHRQRMQEEKEHRPLTEDEWEYLWFTKDQRPRRTLDQIKDAWRTLRDQHERGQP